VEKLQPYDLDVRIRKGNLIKRFALQIKRPHVDPNGVYWDLNPVQHRTMRRYRWIFYALPTFVNSDLQRVACHHVLIVPRSIPHVPRTRLGNLGLRYRWGGFAEAVIECRVGEVLFPERPPLPLEALIQEFNMRNSVLTEVDVTAGIAMVLKTPTQREED